MPPEITNFLSAPILLFLLFGASALVTGITMVLYPNPVRSALFLVLNLFCVAVLYLLLNAYFLAAVQVIVYAGAIMVLFLFVIMLLNLGTPDRTVDRLRWQQPVAVGAALVLALVFGFVIISSVPSAEPPTTQVGTSSTAPNVLLTEETASGRDIGSATITRPIVTTPDTMGTVEGIGQTLYNPDFPWLFPFEATSILLLIAVVGSVVLAKRKLPGDEPLATGEPEGGVL